MATESVESTLAAVRGLMEEIRESDGGETVRLDLGRSLTINDVTTLRDHCLTRCSAAMQISIDASEVEHVDTAGLQLVLSLVRTRVSRGATISFSGVSATFESVVDRLGMRSALGMAD